MAHAVMGYPNLEESFGIVEMYIEKGVEYLELQIPFSHPTADGSTLCDANLKALEAGADMAYCFEFLEQVRKKYPQQKIMLMSYFNRIYNYGINAFIERMQSIGIQHFILPDLPFDAPQAKAFNSNERVQLVPVIAPNLTDARLAQVVALQPDYIYLMSNYQVTGGQFNIHENAKKIIEILHDKTPAKVGVGFGISTKKDVAACLQYADFAIVGSALKLAIDAGEIEEKVVELLGV